MKKRKPTDNQINALKYLIFVSKDANKMTKQVCFALINASGKLTKPVRFPTKEKSIAYGVHDMCSSDLDTHLTEILAVMGTDFNFDSHSVKKEEGGGFMIFLTKKMFDNSAEVISQEFVNKIKLIEPKVNYTG
jgi:hypothetical protein